MWKLHLIAFTLSPVNRFSLRICFVSFADRVSVETHCRRTTQSSCSEATTWTNAMLLWFWWVSHRIRHSRLVKVSLLLPFLFVFRSSNQAHILWRSLMTSRHIRRLMLSLYSITAWEAALLNSPADSIQSYSGSSSPPLSDDGNVSSSSTGSVEQKYIVNTNQNKLQINSKINTMANNARRGQRTTSLSTSDEGIVMDYGEEMSRRRRVSRTLILRMLCTF